MITLKNVKTEIVDGFMSYYSMKKDGFELTLEPCFNGFDVALYDKKGNLLTDKICTNVKDPTSFEGQTEMIQKGIKAANKLWEGRDEELKVAKGRVLFREDT